MTDKPFYVMEVREGISGKMVASRIVRWDFEGIGRDAPGQLTCDEEYQAAMRAKEMYRDAAHAAGKWPDREARLKIKAEYEARNSPTVSAGTPGVG
jgi:hypothetical protein